jgi:hypothetical protein
VLDHARLAVDGFPAVVAAQAQRVAVADHHAFGVAEPAHAIAVAVAHFDRLAVVVAVLDEGFNGQVVDDAFDVAQATQRIVVMQVNPHAARRADVGERTFDGAGEMQVMPEGIFQTLQRHRSVVVGDFAKVEKHVVERLQQVVPALGADQINLFVGVVDAFAGLDVDKGHAAALVVGEVNETAATAQALLPRQDPATAQHAVDGQVAGVEAGPFNRHQAGQHEVGFARIQQQLAAGGEVDGIAGQPLPRATIRPTP